MEGGGGSLWIMPCVLNQCYPVLDRRGLQRLLSCVGVKGSSKVIILFKGEGLSMIIIFCRRGGIKKICSIYLFTGYEYDANFIVP